LDIVEQLKSIDKTVVLVLYSSNLHRMAEKRRFFIEMMHQKVKSPAIIYNDYVDLDDETFQLYSSTDFGALLIDGMSDGVWIKTENCSNLKLNTSTAFGILQATRTRISKTDYISCPSCGRTLFDLQETTAKIRAKTNHLKGLKIGIMGCIVNGPGEMADADYGYVGVGKGKINLYKEKTVVKKSISEDQAVEYAKEKGKDVQNVAHFLKKDKQGREFIHAKRKQYDVETLPPKIYSVTGEEITDQFNEPVGGGSAIRAKVMIKPYYMPTTKTVGVSTKLLAVQIIKNKEFAGGSGFTDESSQDNPPFETEDY